jgi:phage terminase small subunit
MGLRGKKSAAELALVPTEVKQRPPAPKHLSQEEQAEWIAVVGCLPANWFPRESHAALAALCRHTCRSRLIAAQVNQMQTSCLGSEDGINILDKALKMLERETRAILALSRSLRLTPSTRLDRGKSTRMAEHNKPGAFEQYFGGQLDA